MPLHIDRRKLTMLLVWKNSESDQEEYRLELFYADCSTDPAFKRSGYLWFDSPLAFAVEFYGEFGDNTPLVTILDSLFKEIKQRSGFQDGSINNLWEQILNRQVVLLTMPLEPIKDSLEALLKSDQFNAYCNPVIMNYEQAGKYTID